MKDIIMIILCILSIILSLVLIGLGIYVFMVYLSIKGGC